MTHQQSYKIKITLSIYDIRDENRSESVRRQTIYHTEFNQNIIMGTLSNILCKNDFVKKVM